MSKREVIEMQSDAERTLNNLHVLGALSHNDKLMTNEDAFDIYAPTTLRSMVRAWYSEGRVQNMQRVHNTIRAAIGFANRSYDDASALIVSIDSNSTVLPNLKLRFDTLSLQHVRMCEALGRARVGLGHLLQTYRDDATVSSRVSLIMEEIDDFNQIMSQHTERLKLIMKSTSSHSPTTSSSPFRSLPSPAWQRRDSCDGISDS